MCVSEKCLSRQPDWNPGDGDCTCLERYCQLLWRRNFDLGGFLHDSVFENSSLYEEANLLVTV